MNQFGLSSEYLDLIKKAIQEVFGIDTDLKVYLFGSRATGKNKKNSDIDLAFKSKDPNLSGKISSLKEKIENSSLPYKCDLVNWEEIVSEYLPTIKKQKKIFWTRDDIILSSPWRICPIGYHWVRERLKDGNKDTTNPHCRKNPSRKDILKVDEIHRISEIDLFKKTKIKASAHDLGYKDGNKYDELINGWCAYWNDLFKLDEPLHPNHVKALIATESGFQENPPRNKKHTAIGITQIMPKTISLLSQRSKELKDHFIEVSKEDMFNPNVNICSSIRWLFRKRELVRKKKKNADWLDTLEEYKGITKQEAGKSKRIRNDIRKFYEKLNTK